MFLFVYKSGRRCLSTPAPFSCRTLLSGTVSPMGSEIALPLSEHREKGFEFEFRFAWLFLVLDISQTDSVPMLQ